MRECPILFRPPLVRAILDGHKTVTRRVVKARNPPPPDTTRVVARRWTSSSSLEYVFEVPGLAEGVALGGMTCPYGEPGDRLWVRESGWLDLDERRFFKYAATPAVAIDATVSGPVSERQFETSPNPPPADEWKRVPSIHMPRWACRLVLEVTSVRVERLQDISEDDAHAEGTWVGTFPGLRSSMPIEQFRDAWDRINAARGYGWDQNPWVFVITFRRVSA